MSGLSREAVEKINAWSKAFAAKTRDPEWRALQEWRAWLVVLAIEAIIAAFLLHNVETPV